jgi:enamine deaminase RidA (YjgF/YER057c/UK114 family)
LPRHGVGGSKLLGHGERPARHDEQSKVINGCSNPLVEAFGEQHARSAIGVGSLLFGITVEIEALFACDRY